MVDPPASTPIIFSGKSISISQYYTYSGGFRGPLDCDEQIYQLSAPPQMIYLDLVLNGLRMCQPPIGGPNLRRDRLDNPNTSGEETMI